MSDYPTVISFYTNNWLYPKYARDMANTCNRLGLDHYIREEENTSNWLQNTKIKPVFIRKALEELKRPVLWIDVDGSILKRPDFLKEGCGYDFAARPMAEHRDRKWHVGTLYFGYTDAGRALLDRWIERNETHGGTDELNLDAMWKTEYDEFIEGLVVGELPPEYFEMLRQLEQPPSKSTVICHRASKSDSKMRMKAKNQIK